MAAKYGEPVVIGHGQKAALDDGVEVAFVKVTEDSRCPDGTQCMWAGQVGVDITLDGQTHNLILGGKGQGPVTELGAFQCQLQKVDPYPKAGVEPDHTKYAITLLISRK